MKTIFWLSLALVLMFIAAILLMTGIAFGIQRGEMRLNDQAAEHLAGRLRIASQLALVLFVAIEVAAAGAILSSSAPILPRWHWALRFGTSLILSSVISYLCTLCLLNLGGGPDIAIWLYRAASTWLLDVTQ